jgi:NADP-dependent 3-hydroxy acid dehydrogenase YdfG
MGIKRNNQQGSIAIPKRSNEMIQDKVVIITGASSGIGEATAKLLASKGAKLVLGARREQNLQELLEGIQNAGGQAVYQVMDVTKPSDNARVVELAKATFGRVDVIFLNAGIMPNSPLSALKTDEWNQTVDVNIKGVLNGVAAVLPTFISQKSGHIIANSSVAGLNSLSRWCGVWWDKMVCTRFHGSATDGVGSGRDEHSYSDHLSCRN